MCVCVSVDPRLQDFLCSSPSATRVLSWGLCLVFEALGGMGVLRVCACVSGTSSPPPISARSQCGRGRGHDKLFHANHKGA